MKSVTDYTNPAPARVIAQREFYKSRHIDEAVAKTQASGVPPMYADFDAVNPHVPPIVAAHITDALTRITPPGLYLRGNGGKGKTASAAVYCRELSLIGTTCKWWNVVQLAGVLRENHAESNVTLHEAQTTSHLFLDDLCADRKTEWWYETLYRIISYRFDNLLPITVTLNTSDDDMDIRIRRRLTEFAICVELK
jgi:DNA replication protein DnaC